MAEKEEQIGPADAGGAGQGQRTFLSEVMRPRIPMGFYVGAPYVAAVAICESLNQQGFTARIAWPHDVVVAAPDTDPCSVPDCSRISVSARGGYDEEGMFCALSVVSDGPLDLSSCENAAQTAVHDRFASWEEALSRKQAMAGPLAAILSDCFDLVGLMGQQVDIRYPNGRLMATGCFAGVDVWGRASVRLDSGKELQVTPEQARIQPHHAA